MNSYHERQDCRLCSAPLPEERILDLNATPLANALETADHVAGPDYPLFLKQCTTCGHVQLPVIVDPKLLFPADYPYASATGASMREHLRRMAADLTEESFPAGGFAVEIGSNDGFLLECLHGEGWREIGVDPAAKLAEQANRAGWTTLPYFFDPHVALGIKNACGEANLIVANNCMAHIDNLHEIVEGVRVLLAPEGRFVFEVGYFPDVLRANNFGTVYHEHLSYHTLRPLIDFFARHDLGLYDAHRVATQGGSVRCFVRWGAVETPERLFDLVEAERNVDALLDDWQSRVTRAAKIFATGMRGLKSKFPNTTIAAYGCSAKSTTLLHVAGIGRETIDFICDDNPLKQGRWSPGKHIPIVPGSWLEEKQPDYCVSLSENFSEAFRAAHPLYKGEWIEPDLAGSA